MSHLTATWGVFDTYFRKKGLGLKKLLDVGCRDNSSQRFFEELGLKWIGVDIIPQQPQGEVMTMDMTDLKLPDDFADVVFVCHSLEHCENPVKALKEFKRVMKSDGYLFISLPCHCEHHVIESDKDHIFCFTKIQLQRILSYAGFTYVECWDGEIGNGYQGTDRYNLYGVARKIERV